MIRKNTTSALSLLPTRNTNPNPKFLVEIHESQPLTPNPIIPIPTILKKNSFSQPQFMLTNTVLNKKKDPERKTKKEVAKLRSSKAIRISVCQEQLLVV